MIDNVLSEFGRIDVLVNNAFAPYQFDPESRKPFLKMGWSDFENQIKGSLGAVVNVTNAVLEPFLKLGSGSIINIASNLVQRPVVPYHDYISAKSGVISLTKSLAVEMGPYGIRVNAVCPGWVYPSASSMKSKEKSRDVLIEQTPLGRLAQSADIVGPVLFLASQWSGFMTGQVLYVDGGYTMPNG
jgi:3-oxoacyl-[acyl-carrier protein] reductase